MPVLEAAVNVRAVMPFDVVVSPKFWYAPGSSVRTPAEEPPFLVQVIETATAPVFLKKANWTGDTGKVTDVPPPEATEKLG